MNYTNKPLIIGGNHHNTYSLVRCFGEAGVKVDCILCGCSESYVGSSKYIAQLWYCEKEADAIDIVSSLVDVNKKRVVITATDMVASLMDLHYDEFKDKCYFFNAGQAGVITHFMDKEVQTFAASKVGINIPKTFVFSKGEHLYSDIFPCIIKPLASIDGGKRIAICKNQNEIEVHSKEFSDVERVMVQQFIEKDEEIVLLGVALNGEALIPGYIIKYRDIKGGTTYSSTAPVSELNNTLLERAKQFVVNIHYEGLFGIELIRSKDNYYFVEINLRNDATSYSLAVAGSNLPLMYYNACTNNKPLESGRCIRKIWSMVEINDFRNVLHRKVGLFEWLFQLKRAECRYLYSKEDKKPFRQAKREFVSQMIKKIFS